MEKKVVLITGGTSGIGEAIVEIFAKANYNIVINYLSNDEKALKLKERIERQYSILVLTMKADVSNVDEVKKMVMIVKDQLKHIDVLINNAGIALDQTFDDKTEKEFKKVLDVNLIGPFLMAKEVSSIMKEQGYGKIINIASTNGIDTYYPESMDYDASKAGLLSLTKNLATVLAPTIQVNAIAPGWVNTKMNRQLDSEFIEKEKRKILLGRFAESHEIASVVYFLTTEEASYINGTIIRVDGGRKV